MNMDLPISGGCPSLATKVAMLLLIGYPFLLWSLSTYRREGMAPMTASALPAALTPMFVAAAVSWMGIASLLEALSITGAGRVVRAAGVAETLSMITFGGGVAALVCIVSFVRDWMQANAQYASSPSPRVRAWTIAMLSILAIVVVSLFVLAGRIVEGGGLATPVALTFAAIAGVGGVMSLGWLVLSRRRPALQLDHRRRTITAVAAAGALLIAYVSWQLTTIYNGVVMHG